MLRRPAWRVRTKLSRTAGVASLNQSAAPFGGASFRSSNAGVSGGGSVGVPRRRLVAPETPEAERGYIDGVAAAIAIESTAPDMMSRESSGLGPRSSSEIVNRLSDRDG